MRKVEMSGANDGIDGLYTNYRTYPALPLGLCWGGVGIAPRDRALGKSFLKRGGRCPRGGLVTIAGACVTPTAILLSL